MRGRSINAIVCHFRIAGVVYFIVTIVINVIVAIRVVKGRLFSHLIGSFCLGRFLYFFRARLCSAFGGSRDGS